MVIFHESASNLKFPAHFFDNIETIQFRDKVLKILYNPRKLLKIMYGKKWKIPIKGTSANKSDLISTLKYLYSFLPSPLKLMYRKIRTLFNSKYSS